MCNAALVTFVTPSFYSSADLPCAKLSAWSMPEHECAGAVHLEGRDDDDESDDVKHDDDKEELIQNS